MAGRRYPPGPEIDSFGGFTSLFFEIHDSGFKVAHLVSLGVMTGNPKHDQAKAVSMVEGLLSD